MIKHQNFNIFKLTIKCLIHHLSVIGNSIPHSISEERKLIINII